MVTGDDSTNNMYCGVYGYAAGMADINHDGKVNMKDIGYIARRFVVSQKDPLWIPTLTLMTTAKIDTKDTGTAAREFTKKFSSRIGCRQITVLRQTTQSQTHAQTAKEEAINSPNPEPPSGLILGLAICTLVLSKAPHIKHGKHSR